MIKDLIESRDKARKKYASAAKEVSISAQALAILKEEYLSLDKTCKLIAGVRKHGARKNKALFHAVYEKFECRPFTFADIAALVEEFGTGSRGNNLRSMMLDYHKSGYLDRPSRGQYAITEIGKIFFGIASALTEVGQDFPGIADEEEEPISKSDLERDFPRLGGGIMGPSDDKRVIFAEIFKKFESRPFGFADLVEICEDLAIEIKLTNIHRSVSGYAKKGYLTRVSRGQYAITEIGKIFFGITDAEEEPISKSDPGRDFPRLVGGIVGPSDGMKVIFSEIFKKFESRRFGFADLAEIIEDLAVEISRQNVRSSVCGYARKGYLDRLSRGKYAITEVGKVFFGIASTAEEEEPMTNESLSGPPVQL